MCLRQECDSDFHSTLANKDLRHRSRRFNGSTRFLTTNKHKHTKTRISQTRSTSWATPKTTSASPRPHSRLPAHPLFSLPAAKSLRPSGPPVWLIAASSAAVASHQSHQHQLLNAAGSATSGSASCVATRCSAPCRWAPLSAPVERGRDIHSD